MNLYITIPENWNPECTKSINDWYDKINKYTESKRLKTVIYS